MDNSCRRLIAVRERDAPVWAVPAAGSHVLLLRSRQDRVGCGDAVSALNTWGWERLTIKQSAFIALPAPAGSVTVQIKLPQAVDHRLFLGLDAPHAGHRCLQLNTEFGCPHGQRAGPSPNE